MLTKKMNKMLIMMLIWIKIILIMQILFKEKTKLAKNNNDHQW